MLAIAVVTAIAAPKVAPHLAGALQTVLGSEGASMQTSPGDASARAAEGAQGARQRPGSGAVRVSGVIVTPTTWTDVVSSTGTLLAGEAVDLQAETGGRIMQINFEEGARVAKGDLLVKLDAAELEARRATALLELELAERRERRAAELLAQGYVRAEEHEIALNALEVQRAQIGLTEAQLAKTEIRAPFDGLAGLRYVSEGAVVGPSTRIATLQHIDTLKIEFSVSERYAGRIAVGSPISFTVAGHDREFTGRLYARDPRIDEATRTLLLRGSIPNPEGTLLPGGFAHVRLTMTETAEALLIPATALIPDIDSPYVFVVGEGRAVRRRVVTGIRTDSRVQILAGLEPGDIVITSGLQQIGPGSPVEVESSGTATMTDTASSRREPPMAERAGAAAALRR